MLTPDLQTTRAGETSRRTRGCGGLVPLRRSPLSRRPRGDRRGERRLASTLLMLASLGCQTATSGGWGVDARSITYKATGSSCSPSVSGISVHSTKDEVLRLLGPPGVERPQLYDNSLFDYGDMISLEYPGLRLRLANGAYRRGPFRVLEIEIFDPIWTVLPSLHVGMEIEEAERRLPGLKRASDSHRFGRKVLVCAFDVPGTQAGGQLLLLLGRQKVVQIVLTSDLS